MTDSSTESPWEALKHVQLFDPPTYDDDDTPTGYEIIPGVPDIERQPLQVVVVSASYTPIHGNYRGTITMTLSDGTTQQWEGDAESCNDIQRNITRSVDNGLNTL